MFKSTLVAILFFLPVFALADTGAIVVHAEGKYCDPNNSIGTSYGSFDLDLADSVTFNYVVPISGRTGLNNCRTGVFFDDTTSWSAFDYLYMDYSVTVSSGACGVGITTQNNSAFASGSYHTVSTTTTHTINNSGGGYDSWWGMGAVIYGQSGQGANCSGTVTRLYDDNGVDYLNFYDTDSGGTTATTTATTTVYVTEYLPMNVVVTSTLCTEETATTTGYATTTCTNTLSTTTAYTYDLDTTETNNILKTWFLFVVWLSSFFLVLGVLLLFMRTRYGHY